MLLWKNKRFVRLQVFYSTNLEHKYSLISSYPWDRKLFYKKRIFPIQPHWFSSWIELQMFLRCCLIHMSIIILRKFLAVFIMSRPMSIYVVSLWSIFHFHLHFIMINCIILLIQTHLFFSLFFRICVLFLDDNVDKECE